MRCACHLSGRHVVGLPEKVTRWIFKHVSSPLEQAEILKHGTHIVLRAGSFITNEGEPAEHIFVICSGSCEQYVTSDDGETHHQATMKAGDVVGLSSWVRETRNYLASTEVARSGCAVRFKHDDILLLCRKCPSLAEGLRGFVLDKYIKPFVNRNVSTNDAAKRVRFALRELAKDGTETDRGIELRITQKELEERASVGHTKLNDILKEMSLGHELTTGRKKVIVLHKLFFR